ncbi:hypothetical protein TNCV_2268711 [Trichonephila clavipes]|nr:hypothetical protein TNCV_2268711 [Trichonephila clavipes]
MQTHQYMHCYINKKESLFLERIFVVDNAGWLSRLWAAAEVGPYSAKRYLLDLSRANSGPVLEQRYEIKYFAKIDSLQNRLAISTMFRELQM